MRSRKRSIFDDPAMPGLSAEAMSGLEPEQIAARAEATRQRWAEASAPPPKAKPRPKPKPTPRKAASTAPTPAPAPAPQGRQKGAQSPQKTTPAPVYYDAKTDTYYRRKRL